MKTQHQTRYRSGWHSSFSFKYLNSSEKPRYYVQYEEDTHYIHCRMQCRFFLLTSWSISMSSGGIWFEYWVICHFLLHRCCSCGIILSLILFAPWGVTGRSGVLVSAIFRVTAHTVLALGIKLSYRWECGVAMTKFTVCPLSIAVFSILARSLHF